MHISVLILHQHLPYDLNSVSASTFLCKTESEWLPPLPSWALVSPNREKCIQNIFKAIRYQRQMLD